MQLDAHNSLQTILAAASVQNAALMKRVVCAHSSWKGQRSVLPYIVLFSGLGAAVLVANFVHDAAFQTSTQLVVTSTAFDKHLCVRLMNGPCARLLMT